jgi:hypothetical protein
MSLTLAVMVAKEINFTLSQIYTIVLQKISVSHLVQRHAFDASAKFEILLQ